MPLVVLAADLHLTRRRGCRVARRWWVLDAHTETGTASFVVSAIRSALPTLGRLMPWSQCDNTDGATPSFAANATCVIGGSNAERYFASALGLSSMKEGITTC